MLASMSSGLKQDTIFVKMLAFPGGGLNLVPSVFLLLIAGNFPSVS